MSSTKKYRLQDLGDLEDVKMKDGEVKYLFDDRQDPEKKRWIPSTSIAIATKNSKSFNKHLRSCKMVPSRYKSHKDLEKYAQSMKGKWFGFSFEVYVNEEVSSQIMFTAGYTIRYFAGLPVCTIVKDILNQYKKEFYFLPIRPNGIFKNVSDVCFVFFLNMYLTVYKNTYL